LAIPDVRSGDDTFRPGFLGLAFAARDLNLRAWLSFAGHQKTHR